MIISPSELPIEVYHGSGGTPRWWSKTSLRNFQSMGPAWTKLAYIDKTLTQEAPGGALQGLALDCLLTEGPESFVNRFAVKPQGLSLATKEGKQWKIEHEGQEILSHDDALILADASAAVRKCCMWPGIEKSLAQHTIRRDQPALGIGLQARPDWLNVNSGMVLDLKKTRDLSRFGTQSIDLGYHLQAALAGWCAAGDGVCIEHSYLVAVEWERGARCRVYEIPQEILAHADREMRKIAAEVAERIATNNWTDKQEAPEMLPIPAWVERKMGAE
jgi:hypothetical protein